MNMDEQNQSADEEIQAVDTPNCANSAGFRPNVDDTLVNISNNMGKMVRTNVHAKCPC